MSRAEFDYARTEQGGPPPQWSFCEEVVVSVPLSDLGPELVAGLAMLCAILQTQSMNI